MYNLEKLKQENQGSNRFYVDERTVEKVNKHIEILETGNKIKAGDIIRFTTKYGEFYKNAFVDRIDEKDNQVYICESGSAHAFIDDGKVYLSVSGGAFQWVDIDKIKPLNIKEKRDFWTCGSSGACADGGIYYQANMNVWEYKEDKNVLFTTEKYDTRSLYSIKNEIKCSSKGSISSIKLSEKELLNHLNFYQSEVTFDYRGIKLWDYKTNYKYWLNTEEYEKIEGAEVIKRSNGGFKKHKLVYDNNKKIINIFVHEEAIENPNYNDLSNFDNLPKKYNSIEQFRKNLLVLNQLGKLLDPNLMTLKLKDGKLIYKGKSYNFDIYVHDLYILCDRGDELFDELYGNDIFLSKREYSNVEGNDCYGKYFLELPSFFINNYSLIELLDRN